MLSRLVILILKVPGASVNPDSQASVRVGRNTVVIRVIVDTRLKIVDLELSSFPLIQSIHLDSWLIRLGIARLPLKIRARSSTPLKSSTM